MKSLRKALFIVKSQGFHALFMRARAKVEARFRMARDRQLRRQTWRSDVRLMPLQPDSTLVFDLPTAPQVSIIIPAFDQEQYTYNCLQSIRRHLDVPAEVIVVDDGSGEPTQRLLRNVQGIRVVRNSQNMGFIRSCNKAASIARADDIVFLNNDTIVQPRWLSSLLERKRSDNTIGSVGSKLLYPNGAVAEAGAIVWSDGAGLNYGRGAAEDDPACNYVRDVDYCSSASLIVARDDFLNLGGFDLRYVPAYYEDADLAFLLRSKGLRTVFEPRSVVVHFEGASSGTDESRGVKRFQTANRLRFSEKWAAQLEAHYRPSQTRARLAARRLSGSPRILVIDRFVPFEDRDAGSARLMQLLLMLRELHCDVTFYPEDGVAHEPYAQKLRDHGIEVLGRSSRLSGKQQLRQRAGIFDVAWLCRPQIAAAFGPPLRREGAQIWFDSVDLHFVRLQRQESVTGKRTQWQRMKDLELGIARDADATIVTSPLESDLLSAQSVENILILPPIQKVESDVAPWESRRGILFLGNYTHEPNVDAAIYAARNLFPQIVRAIPEVELILAGNEPPPSIRRLQTSNIRVTGHVPDLTPLLQQARVFIAPLRFGSGIKGKLLQSLAHGLPIVTTTVGAEGIALQHGVSALIADRSDAMTQSVCELYEQRDLWERMSRAGLGVVSAYRPEVIRTTLERFIHSSNLQASNAAAAK